MGDVVKMVQGKTVELGVLERMTLLNVLPKEGTFLNLKLVRVKREELSFTEEENKRLQFRQIIQEGQQMLQWNLNAVVNKAMGDLMTAPNEVLGQMVAKDPEAFEVTPACPPKEFTFGPVIEGLIVKALKDLDKQEKITQDHYSLYEKFMEGHEDEPGEETCH